MDTLYVTFGSGNSFKPALVLRQTGRRCLLQFVDVLAGQTRRPEFLALNPRGQVWMARVRATPGHAAIGELLAG